MDRCDAYRFTGKMPKPAGRDNTMLRTNSAEDVESLRLENVELKKMILELKQSVQQLAAGSGKKSSSKKEAVKEEPKADEAQ